MKKLLLATSLLVVTGCSTTMDIVTAIPRGYGAIRQAVYDPCNLEQKKITLLENEARRQEQQVEYIEQQEKIIKDLYALEAMLLIAPGWKYGTEEYNITVDGILQSPALPEYARNKEYLDTVIANPTLLQSLKNYLVCKRIACQNNLYNNTNDSKYQDRQYAVRQESEQGTQQDMERKIGAGGLEPNAYGYGVHKNKYGQAVQLRPDYGYVPGERLEIRENAYGLGVHSDQYGRPVREYPYP